MTTHKMSYTSTYKTWESMKQRCLNPKYTGYKNYGGRGIKVCDRWLKFENFYKDIGKRPNNRTIDRIDNNKGYYKENCRWANKTTQVNNRRDNRLIKYKGETKTLPEWARFYEINLNTLKWRIYSGWEVEKAFTKPIEKKFSHH